MLYIGLVATKRDTWGCLITGPTSNDIEFEVSWIFPPAWAKWVRVDVKPHFFVIILTISFVFLPQALAVFRALSILSNGMLMRRDMMH